jgi:hypothetical protein
MNSLLAMLQLGNGSAGYRTVFWKNGCLYWLLDEDLGISACFFRLSDSGPLQRAGRCPTAGEDSLNLFADRSLIADLSIANRF